MSRILISLGQSRWDSELASVLAHPIMGFSFVRTCKDAQSVRESISSDHCHAMVVSDHASHIDAQVITAAVKAGIRVIAITVQPERWMHLGVAHCINPQEHRAVTVAKDIANLIRNETSIDNSIAKPREQGFGVVVAGFGGGAGRTSCVRELGFAFAQINTDSSVLMADADTFGASLAQQLGDESVGKNLLAICRSFETGTLEPTTWRDHVISVHRNLFLLPGIHQSSRWADVRSVALAGMWKSSLSQFDVVIADVGPGIDLDKGWISAGPNSMRNTALTTTVNLFENIVLCTRADSVGITRLVRGYLDTGSSLDSKFISVVVMGTQSRAHAKDIQRAISRHTGLTQIYCVPAKSDVFHQASSHNTFAGVVDREIAGIFESIARDITNAMPEVTRDSGIAAVNNYLKTNVA